MCVIITSTLHNHCTLCDGKSTADEMIQSAVKAEFTAEYVVSQAMKVSFFFDRSVSKPRVSTSYPISTTKFGFKLHLLLTESTSRDD